LRQSENLTSTPWAVRLSWLENAYWRSLFSPGYPYSRSYWLSFLCAITVHQ